MRRFRLVQNRILRRRRIPFGAGSSPLGRPIHLIVRAREVLADPLGDDDRLSLFDSHVSALVRGNCARRATCNEGGRAASRPCPADDRSDIVDDDRFGYWHAPSLGLTMSGRRSVLRHSGGNGQINRQIKWTRKSPGRSRDLPGLFRLVGLTGFEPATP